MEENNKNSQEDAKLHDLLIKQHSLLLQQYETMSKLQQQNNEKADEIDLSRLIPKFLRKNQDEKHEHSQSKTSYVAHKAKKSFYHVIKGFLNLLREYYANSVKRFAYIVVILFVFAASYGVYVYMTADKIYSSTMTLDGGNLENSFFQGLVENLGNLARTKSSSELARKLDLSLEQASLITDFQFNVYEDYFIEEQKLTDSTEQILDYPFFTVTVNVLDNSVLKILNTNLFEYLRSNPYVNEIKKVKKEVLKQSISNLDMQLASIDSLKLAIVKRVEKKNTDNQYWVKETSNAGGGLILSQEEPLDMSPMMPFEKALSVQKEQLADKEKLLRLDTDFKIIDDFSAIEEPVFPRVRNILFFSLYGFILGSIIAFILVLFFPKKKQA